MSNLKDIHNCPVFHVFNSNVALSGFQWAIWRIYTTSASIVVPVNALLYQDFNEQFEGYTQQQGGTRGNAPVALSGFQWAIWRIYTTNSVINQCRKLLLYQDFNEQFEGYTQPIQEPQDECTSCFIRISMSNLKDIHNMWLARRTKAALLYQDFNEQFEGYTQHIAEF